jgi:hypothetical protein
VRKKRSVYALCTAQSKTDGYVIQLREIELKVQREINEKRQELLAKEESLRFVINDIVFGVV